MHLLLLVTLSPVGRATGPPCRRVPARDPFENKKFYRKVPVAHCLGDRCLSPPRWATGGYFCNLLKRPYIFEILFFLNIKKKKPLQEEAISFLFFEGGISWDGSDHVGGLPAQPSSPPTLELGCHRAVGVVGLGLLDGDNAACKDLWRGKSLPVLIISHHKLSSGTRAVNDFYFRLKI